MTQTTQFTSQLRSAFTFGYRLARRFALVIGVVVAVVLVSTLTIDLGPAIRARAEIAGSNWLERKLTIGRLGIHLGAGSSWLRTSVSTGCCRASRPGWSPSTLRCR